MSYGGPTGRGGPARPCAGPFRVAGLLALLAAGTGCGPGGALVAPGTPDAGPALDADPGPDTHLPSGDTALAPESCFSEPAAGPARALFEVPRPGRVGRDPFALPFPNNLRRLRGALDFPEIAALGPRGPDGAIVQRYLEAVAQDRGAFGLVPAVYFRFTRPLGPVSLAELSRTGAIRFVDLTPASRRGGRGPGDVPFSATVSEGGRYLCPRSLIVQPVGNLPLLPARTYAVIVTRALHDQAGQPFARDPDFEAVLADAPPIDPALHAAWKTFAPLRGWARANGQDRAAFVSATVFSTEAPETRAAALHAAVARSGRAGFETLEPCSGSGLPGCGACPEPDPGFVEYQGRLRFPVFQAGQPPYEDRGGNIRYGADSLPVVQRTEAVCVSLTLPAGSAPRAGWPLVVYAHGTGGSFRWHAGHGLAGDFARGQVDGGPAVPMAMLGFDGVLHGSRKGDSDRPSTELVYNLLNPAAARDNNLQAAADLFAVAAAVPELARRDLPVRTDRVGLYGHSQGGNAAAIAAVFEPRYDLVVLSGTGGGLTASLLLKQEPVAPRALLGFLLGDAQIDETHPVLSLLQTYFDPVDPLVHARRLVHAPLGGRGVPHVFHVFGLHDRFAPDETQRRFGAAAHLPARHAERGGGDPGPGGWQEGPARGNLQVGGRAVTALQARYGSPGEEGHFVSTQDAGARAAILRFFGSGFRDGVPTVE